MAQNGSKCMPHTAITRMSDVELVYPILGFIQLIDYPTRFHFSLFQVLPPVSKNRQI